MENAQLRSSLQVGYSIDANSENQNNKKSKAGREQVQYLAPGLGGGVCVWQGCC
jgi:hypothetical protein